jgi:glycosyltransferase involved in cell wall biosynthesis
MTLWRPDRHHGRRYDLVVALDYYAPYVSGLTNEAREIAEQMSARGWRVAVVASQHDPSLPKREILNGVEVHRTSVIAHIRKGIVSPLLPFRAAALMRRARVANLHLPMIEAGLISRLVGSTAPLIVTYHCDVVLGPDLVSSIVLNRLDASSRSAVRRAAAVCATSHDYARTSRVLAAHADETVVIPPVCKERSPGTPTYRDGKGFHVGFVGRIVEEKGLEYLVEAFGKLEDPNARLLIAGDYTSVAGGSVIDYVRRKASRDPRVRLLGFVPDDQLPDFYASIDVFVLPSVNSLEAFGIAQVEAMLAGVPVIASDLPGMRLPVAETSYGRLVPPRDAPAIHAALSRFVAGDGSDSEGRDRARALFGLHATVDAYEKVFADHAGTAD